jgi:pimeloyl-ACP methyl ester carboxylesterase
MANWCHGLLDAQAIDVAAIVGHSMGSLIAFNFASRHPERTRVLVLLGTSSPMPVTQPLLDAAQDNDHAAIDMVNTWSHSPGGRLGANQNPGVWMLGSGERLLEKVSKDVFYTDLNACNEFVPKGEVTSPAMVITGERDQMTPANAGIRVAESLPEAELVNLEDCGHSMMAERPNAVLDALIRIV